MWIQSLVIEPFAVEAAIDGDDPHEDLPSDYQIVIFQSATAKLSIPRPSMYGIFTYIYPINEYQ